MIKIQLNANITTTYIINSTNLSVMIKGSSFTIGIIMTMMILVINVLKVAILAIFFCSFDKFDQSFIGLFPFHFVAELFLFSNFLINSRMIGKRRKHEPKKVLYFSTISYLKAQYTKNTYRGYKIQ